MTHLFIFELEHPFIDNPARCTKHTAIRLGAQGEEKLFAMANEAKIPVCRCYSSAVMEDYVVFP